MSTTVLAGLDPLEPGVQGRGLGVAFGGFVGVGGGELGRQERRHFGSFGRSYGLPLTTVVVPPATGPPRAIVR
jgi:hypothetical protein